MNHEIIVFRQTVHFKCALHIIMGLSMSDMLLLLIFIYFFKSMYTHIYVYLSSVTFATLFISLFGYFI